MGIKKQLKRGVQEVLRYIPGKKAVNTPVLYGELIKDRTALITGGSSGIGYEIARAFLRNGADVIITGRNSIKLEAATKELNEEFTGRNIHYFVMDNTDIATFAEAFDKITNVISKKVDILVNNAGVVNKTSFGNAEECDYDTVMNTDLKGPYFLTQVVVEYMIKNKIQGNILNISSSSSIRPALSPYHFAKWSMRGFTMGLAKELCQYGITVNGLAPGPTATEMLVSDDNINRPTSPVGRYATPEEIANLAVVLVSDLGKMIVGETIMATGGCGNLTVDDWN